MTTATDAKTIQYVRSTRDYAAYLDGEYIGSFATYHDAEIELDRLMLDRLEQGLTDTVPATLYDSQPGGSGGGDGLMQMPEGDWLDTDGMRVAAPTAARRELAFCEVCGKPGTCDPDEDYVCDDCARAVVHARPAEPVVEAIKGDDDAQRGLYRKYHVERLNDPDGKHRDCPFFVLDLRHDPFAHQALGVYIDACQFEYPQLADDLAELLRSDATHARPADLTEPVFVAALPSAPSALCDTAPGGPHTSSDVRQGPPDLATCATPSPDRTSAATPAASCHAHGCDKPATNPGLVVGMPMCDACHAAGMAKLYKVIFWTGPRCVVCKEPLDVPGWCGECLDDLTPIGAAHADKLHDAPVAFFAQLDTLTGVEIGEVMVCLSVFFGESVENTSAFLTQSRARLALINKAAPA